MCMLSNKTSQNVKDQILNILLMCTLLLKEKETLQMNTKLLSHLQMNMFPHLDFFFNIDQ